MVRNCVYEVKRGTYCGYRGCVTGTGALLKRRNKMAGDKMPKTIDVVIKVTNQLWEDESL
jgi:hypothetical protein